MADYRAMPATPPNTGLPSATAAPPQPPPGWTEETWDGGGIYWLGPDGTIYDPTTRSLIDADGNEQPNTSLQDFMAYYGPGGPGSQGGQPPSLTPAADATPTATGAPASGPVPVRATPPLAGNPARPNFSPPAPALPPAPGIRRPTEEQYPLGDPNNPATRVSKYVGRSLEDVLSGMLNPGSTNNGGALGAQELDRYFPFFRTDEYAGDMPRASANVTRSMGLTPNIGNPLSDYVQSLVDPLAYQSSRYRAGQGRLADTATDPEDPNSLLGREGLRRTLSDVQSTVKSGNTSMVNPQEGLQFLRDLAETVRRAGQGVEVTPDQAAIAGAISAPGSGFAEAWDTMQQMIGQAMSPYLQANPAARNRGMELMRQGFANSAQPGQSALDFLLQAYR